jgi:hypothetical protein
MPPPDQDPRWAAMDRFRRAYCTGLYAFMRAVEEADPQDEAAFKLMLRLALSHFGLTARGLAERLGRSQRIVGRWVNADGVPDQSTREDIRAWVLAETQQQLDAHLCSSYSDIAGTEARMEPGKAMA